MCSFLLFYPSPPLLYIFLCQKEVLLFIDNTEFKLPESTVSTEESFMSDSNISANGRTIK